MIKAPIELQDLRRRIYVKAKAEPTWRFWGLYVHVCKLETLHHAYRLAKANNGAPGLDGVTFAAIEAQGLAPFLARLREELVTGTYRPARLRKRPIDKGGGKLRILSIPTIRDRVVQGALKLILEPIFEVDFQAGSYGYRPGRSAHQAVARVAHELVCAKTRVLDFDLRAFFDHVRHHLLLAKLARRINDPQVLGLVKQLLRATGKQGIPQGGVLSPLLANVYLNEVDRMLERARETTREAPFTRIEYARYADDLVILVDGFPRHDWLLRAVNRRLREELAKLQIEVNEEKSRIVDVAQGESFGFLGFAFRRVRSRRGVWRPQYEPQMKRRTALLQKLKTVFRKQKSQPAARVVAAINPILRGWVRYFAVGHASRCFSYLRNWVEQKLRRHLMRARQRRGFGWRRWTTAWLYDHLGLFSDYRKAAGAVSTSSRLHPAAP